jgi:FMN phosphatase YigB (HAD superfamily)
MIKAVLFDAIDTLFAAYPDKIGMYLRIIKKDLGFDSDRDKMDRAWNKVLADTEKRARDEIRHHQNIGAWDGFNGRLLKELGYEGDLDESGKKLLFESWCNPDNFVLFPDVLRTLNYLVGENILIGCVSNEREELKEFFRHHQIDEYFDTVVISDEVACEKPNAEIFDIALDSLNLKPDEAMFIGDSIISDYEGAKNAGLLPVLIDRDKKCMDNNITRINYLYDIKSIIEGANQNAYTIT